MIHWTKLQTQTSIKDCRPVSKTNLSEVCASTRRQLVTVRETTRTEIFKSLTPYSDTLIPYIIVPAMHSCTHQSSSSDTAPVPRTVKLECGNVLLRNATCSRRLVAHDWRCDWRFYSRKCFSILVTCFLTAGNFIAESHELHESLKNRFVDRCRWRPIMMNLESREQTIVPVSSQSPFSHH